MASNEVEDDARWWSRGRQTFTYPTASAEGCPSPQGASGDGPGGDGEVPEPAAALSPDRYRAQTSGL